MTEDWGTYRKLFDHPSTEFLQLPFFVRATAAELIRYCDRIGRLVKGDELEDMVISRLVFHVRVHPIEVQAFTDKIGVLLADGYLVFDLGWLKIRNFAKAQRSDAADRMKNKRARDSSVTSRDERYVTDSSYECAQPSSRLVSSDLISDPEASERKELTGDRARDPRTAAHVRAFENSFVDRAGLVATTVETWVGPTADHVDQSSRAGLELDTEVADFRDKARSRGLTSCAWDAEFSRWLRNSVKFLRRDQAREQARGAKAPGIDEHERRTAAEKNWIPPKRGKASPAPIGAVLPKITEGASK